jgi:hypothetical protein
LNALLAALSEAFTPVGTPDTENTTLPENPLWSMTLITLLALPAPGTRVIAATEGERLKLGEGIVSTTGTLLVTLPDFPITVTSYVPGVAAAPTLNVNPCVVEFTPVKADVTPLGTPDADKFTGPARPT